MARQSYLSDHVDDYVAIASPSLSGDFTVSWWFYMTSKTDTSNFFGDNANANYFRHNTGGSFYFININGEFFAPAVGSAIGLNVWTHYLIIRASGVVKLWKGAVGTDPVDDTTLIASGSTATWIFDRLVGHDTATGVLPAACRSFDFRIYGVAADGPKRTILNQFGEIADPYVRAYRCQENHATIAYDVGPSQSHGTKTNTVPATFNNLDSDVPHDYFQAGAMRSRQQLLVPPSA